MPDPKKAEPTAEEKMDAWGKRMDDMCSKMDAFLDGMMKKDAKRTKADDDDEGMASEGEDMPMATAADDAEEGEADPSANRAPVAPWARDKRKADAAKQENALLTAQSKADAVAMHWGRRAPQPMMGETPRSYRRRMMKMFQQHSPDYRRADLSLISDPSAFSAAEKQIYADAVRASTCNEAQGPGVLREIQRMDQSGRIISEFVGSVGAMLEPFRMPVYRVKAINKQSANW